jgi:hypothetical protein
MQVLQTKITQSSIIPANLLLSGIAIKKFDKKIPHLPSNDGRCGYN